MKKRIISFVLVVVMAVIALAGCSYKYEKDDMSKYADFDKDAFFAALSMLQIEDGDFGTDEDARWLKVDDAIFTALADNIVKNVKDGDKKTEGTPAKYDVVYYNYYYEATFPILDKDGKETGETETVRFEFDTGMNISKAVKLQLGLSTLKDLNAKYAEKLSGIDFKDYVYKTKSGTTVNTADNDLVYVSYTKVFTANDEDKTQTTITENYVPVLLKSVATGEAATFESALIGKAASGNNVTIPDINETIDGVSGTSKYSSIKIHWVVESQNNNLSFEDVTYDEKKEVKDIDGKTRDLKGVTLTYYVYPTYYLSVPSELSAEVILNDVFGKNITVNSLECFSNEIYKYKDENGNDVTIKSLVEKHAGLCTDLETAKTNVTNKETALSTAEKNLEEAEKKYKENESNADYKQDVTNKTQQVTNAKENLEEAKEELAKAEEARKTNVANILKCGAEGSAEMMDKTICDEYKESKYDALESSYKSTIRSNLATAIYEAAKKYIVIKHDSDGNAILPEKAFDKAFNALWDNYEATYYSGSGKYKGAPSSNAESNYKYYTTKYGNDGFEHFLRYAVETDYTDYKFDLVDKDFSKVYDALGQVVADSISNRVRMYYIAEFIGEKFGKDVYVTEEQIDEFKTGTQYYILYLLYANGDEKNIKEDDYVPAILTDNIFDFLLTETEVDDENKTDNKVVFDNIKYTIKEEENK